ncbi:MAG: hypothetical protein EBR23_10110, partial [Planctomycetia bacterium]|nr:hypothetical protein [Planctomycetia bacterium]
AVQTRPNIIFVFSDDHAQRAISAYGSVVNRTPHIDRLASGGARFVNSFVTNSICTPSRATLLTGQYSHVNGVPVFNRFDGSRDHVAKRMQAGGYHTGMIGKWHLGCEPSGFDRWAVLPGQGAYWNPTFLVPGHSVSIRGHVTEVTVELGIQFLETRPRDKPFFLMLHHKAPHRAWEPDQRNQARFREAVIPEPETLFDEWPTRPAALPENRQTIARDLTHQDLKGPPPAGLVGRELTAWKYRRYMQDYLACVQGVDDAMGRLLDHLERSGLADDTIVIYSSDNGWYMGELGLYDKRFMYEPGLRVPLLARGPGNLSGCSGNTATTAATPIRPPGPRGASTGASAAGRSANGACARRSPPRWPRWTARHGPSSLHDAARPRHAPVEIDREEPARLPCPVSICVCPVRGPAYRMGANAGRAEIPVEWSRTAHLQGGRSLGAAGGAGHAGRRQSLDLADRVLRHRPAGGRGPARQGVSCGLHRRGRHVRSSGRARCHGWVLRPRREESWTGCQDRAGGFQPRWPLRHELGGAAPRPRGLHLPRRAGVRLQELAGRRRPVAVRGPRVAAIAPGLRHV